jgi:ribosomal protein S10
MTRLIVATLLCALLGTAQASAQNPVSQQLMEMGDADRNASFTLSAPPGFVIVSRPWWADSAIHRGIVLAVVPSAFVLALGWALVWVLKGFRRRRRVTNPTSEASPKPDPLERACALVGRFLHHFARVEQKIDQAIIKLLELDERVGSIVTGSVDFAKKVNVVKTYAYEQASDASQKTFSEGVCNRVFKINIDRTIVAHSLIEPTLNGGVQFIKTVVKDGRRRPSIDPLDLVVVGPSQDGGRVSSVPLSLAMVLGFP